MWFEGLDSVLLEDVEMVLHRLAILVILILTTSGCQSVVGPFERNWMPAARVDDPRLSIEEQQARGRARLAYPDQTLNQGPRTFAEVPNSLGR